MVRMIAQGLRIDSGSPATEIELPPSSGGSRVKTLGYALVPKAASSSSDQLGVRVEHGPDQSLWATHTAESLANIGTLLVVEADDTAILGEHVRAVLVTSTNANEWFVLDVYEITRPSEPRRTRCRSGDLA